ncbi:MAG: hypothetical protein HYW23_03825 [Candidatus Aenigmarchaeota archaeon]|nr:hypothetical protein [Candidatus Aenigmarchaeota archaeon]
MTNKILTNFIFGFVASILMLSGVVFAQGFQDAINSLKDIGVFQFYLPFIIAFGIFYALLDKTKIFGEQKALNVLVAAGIAGFILVQTPVGILFSEFLTRFIGGTLTIILTFMVVIILVVMFKNAGIIGTEGQPLISAENAGWILGISALLAVGVFLASGGTSIFPGIQISANQLFGTGGPINSGALTMIILIGGTALLIFLASRGDGRGDEGTTQGQATPRR